MDRCRSRMVAVSLGIALLGGAPGASLQAAAEDVRSSSDIETAIQDLQEPIDYEQVNAISLHLMRIESAEERARLEALLDQRLRALMHIAEPSDALEAPASEEHVAAGPQGPTLEELKVRIATLTLGPDATVDDLRARDELVASIAAIRDPIQREELLKELEETEHILQADVDHAAQPQSCPTCPGPVAHPAGQ